MREGGRVREGGGRKRRGKGGGRGGRGGRGEGLFTKRKRSSGCCRVRR